MVQLIDGYNLLHMLGWIDSRHGQAALEQARERLVRFLSSVLSPAQRAGTTVVFDAASPPPELPREIHPAGMTVLFAVDYPSADDLLEELIEQAQTPKKYVVVSSDRRVQRAALRRQMQAVDCWTWYERLASKSSVIHRPTTTSDRPTWTFLPLSDYEVDHWVSTFFGPEGTERIGDETLLNEELPGGIDNPFPPGYGEDVENEESS